MGNMPDRGKVTEALELCIEFDESWGCIGKCPYYGQTECNCYTQVMKDALELLKPKKPEMVNGLRYRKCGACGNGILVAGQSYCGCCGTKVDWDG